MIQDFIDLNEGINLVYGEPATGKTTLALMIAYNHSKFYKVIFIDTENGFNTERFKQIAQEKYKDCLKNIIILKANNFNEQEKIITNIQETNKTSLIILDTIGSHYRLELKNNFKEANNKIINMLKILKQLNNKNINVLITNQVYNDFNTNKIQSVGGEMLKKFCDVVIKLNKSPRKIIREKPGNAEVLFDIKNEGILIK